MENTDLNQSNQSVDSNDGICVICCESISFYAIGHCDHPVCFKCSSRMRVLSKQISCASCKAEMDQVVFAEELKPFKNFKLQSLSGKRKHGIRFEKREILEEFESLLDYKCVECEESKSQRFFSLQELKSHLRRSHDKQFCDICVENLSVFPQEWKVYTKKELVIHRKEGDKDDLAHRGHPDCRFCDDRFFDNDKLLYHLRKNHFWCHFCEHDGKQDYFNLYKDLRKHFSMEHYLCDEGKCMNEKFTSVFRDKIDFQAHKLAHHGKNLNKIQAKEARRVDLDYSFSRRSQQQKSNNITGKDYQEVQYDDNKHYNQKKHKYDRSREQRNDLMNFNDYEDVEKERRIFKAKKMKNREDDENRDFSLEGASAAMETSRTPSPLPYDDDDVIGLSEHVNKHEKVEKVEKAEPQKTENKQQQKREEPKPKIQEVKPVKSEERKKEIDSNDFPSLNGSNTVTSNPMKPKADINEDPFPALVSKKTSNEPISKSWRNNGIEVKKKQNKKGKSWTKQSGRNIDNDDDFPTLTTQNTKKTNNKSNRTTETGNDRLVIDEKKGRKSPNVPPKKAPPGFSQDTEKRSQKAAPGFSETVSSSKQVTHVASENIGQRSKQAPPGLSEKGGLRSKQAPPGLEDNPGQRSKKDPPGLSNNAEQRSKHVPPGLENINDTTKEDKMERNRRLLEMLQMFLDNFNLGIFKQLSGNYRLDIISGEQYYVGIQELLGENLKMVFSELVALLPDEKKQQELLVMHNNDKLVQKHQKQSNSVNKNADYSRKSTWGSSKDNTKTVKPAKEQNHYEESYCSQCGETFPKTLILDHIASHSGEAFPALPTAVVKKKNYNFMNVRKNPQIPVRSAWGSK